MHEIHGELSVLPLFGWCERLHNLLVVAQHLLLLPRPVRLSLLAIEQLRLRRPIMKMLDSPPFVSGPVNPT